MANSGLFPQKPWLRSQGGPVLPLHTYTNGKRFDFICVGKHYILYCAIHYYRKKDCFCRKGWRFEEFCFFVLFNGPVTILAEVICARRIEF